MADEHVGAAAPDWGSDFFGTLNEMPPEPVTGISQVLETMSTLSAYQDARRWLFQNLGIGQGSAVMEAGCGTGAALSDIVSVVGPKGRIVGNDPTKAFVESARARAGKQGASNAQYELGDIRSMSAKDTLFING